MTNYGIEIIPDEVKNRLLAQILLEFTIREHFDYGSLPLHGIILLIGPPGTGKTSLAKGLASKAATTLNKKPFQFIEVDPYALTSSALGKSQREVKDFLHGTIAEHSINGPLIVLLDEVETLAADRSKMSLEANPIDVHRATDALLAGLDTLASKSQNLLFIATSNFEKAIDSAFLSRVDLIERIDKPDRSACKAILHDTIETMAQKWPKLKNLVNNANFDTLADEAVGLDGRQIRKSIIYALTFCKDTALNPNHLSLKDIQRSIRHFKEKQL
ncbi:MAG: AAA family ATPase [Candidatus Jettenia sp.]|nr:AAA family ATPase [Candidatus Jettenia sp.]